MIEKVQKRALRALYNVYDMSLSELLTKDGASRIHIINIRCLLVEIFKTVHELNPPFMKDIFVSKLIAYPLRNPDLLVLPQANTVRYGLNSITFRSGILWNKLPNNLKNITTLNAFKEKIKSYSSPDCTCLLCKV